MSLTNVPDTESVYRLTDLKNWKFEGVSLAVIGHPIAHSVSPSMHNAALSLMSDDDSRFSHWRYFKFDILPEDLSSALPLFYKKKFIGLNLTLPHKVEAVPLIAKVDPAAQRVGAVNTLHWRDNGYQGYNTDGYGLEKAIQCDLDMEIKDATVILLGSGGASRSAAVQCLEGECEALWIGNRNQDRLAALLNSLRTHRSFSKVKGFTLSSPPPDLPETGLLINATSLGLQKEDPPPINLDRFDHSLKIFDLIYKPAETALLRNAASRGMKSSHGLTMLVSQGARSLEIWSASTVPAEAMMNAARKTLSL
jgi:shikimate dehydrogenase